MDFEVECHGQKIKGKTCHNVKEGEEVKFYANVSVAECKGDGTLPVSVGVFGYNDISAVYVTPICACECEKLKNHRRQDYACNAAGSLVCGQCVCATGFGGRKCECDLAKNGVTSAKQLDDRCRKYVFQQFHGRIRRQRLGSASYSPSDEKNTFTFPTIVFRNRFEDHEIVVPNLNFINFKTLHFYDFLKKQLNVSDRMFHFDF